MPRVTGTKCDKVPVLENTVGYASPLAAIYFEDYLFIYRKRGRERER